MVEPGDVDGLAQAMVKLGSDPDARQSMGEAGRRLMQERFDKQRQFDRFLDYFTQLAATD
jgi:glycosyltransferase involved in cell wall biosynthesis